MRYKESFRISDRKMIWGKGNNKIISSDSLVGWADVNMLDVVAYGDYMSRANTKGTARKMIIFICL